MEKSDDAPGIVHQKNGSDFGLYIYIGFWKMWAMTMTRKEKLVNLALGVGTLLNPSLAQAQPPHVGIWAAIGSDFSMVGKYLSYGITMAQGEVKDVQKRPATQTEFPNLLDA